MGVSTSLSDETLTVVPGEEAVCTVTVRNTGLVVDQITVEVVGAAADWSVVEPPALNLYPGDTGEVRVHFRPPRAAEPAAGPVPFGVRAASREDPAGSVVDEGVVEVAAFTDVRVTLLPQISRGGRRGRHKLDVANLGNAPVGTEIVAVDQDDELKFAVSRPAFVTGPGLVTRSKVVAVPRRTFWTGQQQTRPFEIVVQPERGDATAVTGTFEQQPLVPRWVVPALAAALVLALLLGTLWFTLVRPAVKSAATEAAAKAVASEQAKQSAAARNEENGDGPGPNGSGDGTTGSPSPLPSVTGTPGAVPTPPAALTAPFDFRIQTNAAPRTSGFNLFNSSSQGSRPIDVSDILLQNPAGDSGTIQIRRGSTVVFAFGLDNFRDNDYHFVVPLHFKKNEKLTIAVQCRNPAPESRPCTAAVTVGGKTTP